MSILPYKQIEDILNEKIIGNHRLNLVMNLSESPGRYVGIFKPTNPNIFPNI